MQAANDQNFIHNRGAGSQCVQGETIANLGYSDISGYCPDMPSDMLSNMLYTFNESPSPRHFHSDYSGRGTNSDSYDHNSYSITDTNDTRRSLDCGTYNTPSPSNHVPITNLITGDDPVDTYNRGSVVFNHSASCSYDDTQHNIRPNIQSEPLDAASASSQKRYLDDITGYSDTEHDTQRKMRKKRGKLPDVLYQNLPEATKGMTQEPPEIAKEDILFACPFYKRNPARYSKKYWKACFGPGWGISRLKSVPMSLDSA